LRRPELFGQCTSEQLRERAVQIAKGLIDVAFKRKFQKELRQLIVNFLIKFWLD